MLDTPILFLIFNRPDFAIKVLSQIAKIKPNKLYVAADGPRLNTPNDIGLCSITRSIVEENITWDCKVTYLFREENLGCKLAVSQAINWFFEKEEAGIILEDDCLPDLSFFPYCQELLERFKDDKRILSINGCNLGYNNEEASYFYSRYHNPWGWATWRRAAQQISYEISEWANIDKLRFLKNRLRTGIVDFDLKWIEYWKINFDTLSSGKFDSWAYFWSYHQFKYKKLTIVPSRNLIENIGFNNSATHTTLSEHPAAHLKINTINFPLLHNCNINFCVEYEENFVKPIHYMHHRLPNSFYLKKWITGLPFINKIFKRIRK
jgi:hypothetical protein